jgi:perosamine synthetase
MREYTRLAQALLSVPFPLSVSHDPPALQTPSAPASSPPSRTPAPTAAGPYAPLRPALQLAPKAPSPRPFGRGLEALSSSVPWRTHPRKRLSLTFAALGRAAATGMVSSERGRPRAAASVREAWGPVGDGVMVMPCYSVRTGFDLLLSVKGWERGAEVIMTAVTIRDMVRIVQRHGLVAVAVDIDQASLAPDPAAVEAAITSQTRAIYVAHLFGAVVPLEPLVQLARRHKLLLIEDCAQAFGGGGGGGGVGGGSYQGRKGADVSMFSFGTIKTCTALGGAVLVVRDPPTAAAMAVAESRLPVQSTRRYLANVAKAAVLHAWSTPALCGLLAGCLAWTPWGYDAIITGAVRSFPARDDDEFFRLIRQRPCVALLGMMAARIRDTRELDHVTARAHRGRELRGLLSSVKGVAVPGRLARPSEMSHVTLADVLVSALGQGRRRRRTAIGSSRSMWTAPRSCPGACWLTGST